MFGSFMETTTIMIICRNGWFVFETIVDGEPMLRRSYRKADFIKMTNTLRARSADTRKAEHD